MSPRVTRWRRAGRVLVDLQTRAAAAGVAVLPIAVTEDGEIAVIASGRTEQVRRGRVEAWAAMLGTSVRSAPNGPTTVAVSTTATVDGVRVTVTAVAGRPVIGTAIMDAFARATDDGRRRT